MEGLTIEQAEKNLNDLIEQVDAKPAVHRLLFASVDVLASGARANESKATSEEE